MKMPNLFQAGLKGLVTVLLALAAPEAAQASAGGMGTGRLLPAVAAMVGLAGVFIGRRALARSRMGNGRTGAVLASMLGLSCMTLGGLHASNAAGGFGTGNGLAGAIVALVVGLISTVLGGLALVRLRRRSAGGDNSAAAGPKERP